LEWERYLGGCSILRTCIHDSVKEINFLQPSPGYTLTGASLKPGIDRGAHMHGFWWSRTAIWWPREYVLENMPPEYIDFYGSSRATCPIII